MNLVPVPEQVHILTCNRAFPEVDENGHVIPFESRRIPRHHVSRGRVLLDPRDKTKPGSCLRIVCGKASVHNDQYRFESGLKWGVTNAVAALALFPTRPNLDGFLAFEIEDLDNPTYGLFQECISHIRTLVASNNFPTGSAVGSVIYDLISDLGRLWLPLAPAHCQWVSKNKDRPRKGAFVRLVF